MLLSRRLLVICLAIFLSPFGMFNLGFAQTNLQDEPEQATPKAMAGNETTNPEKVLKLYVREGFFDNELVAAFSNETDIELVLETYKTSDEMLQKMQSGEGRYDIVMQPANLLPLLTALNSYAIINHMEYPSWAELDPKLLALVASWDPGNQRLVPYLWGTVGMSYDVDAVQGQIAGANLASLDMVFKPENAMKLHSCGLSLLDMPELVVPMVAQYLGAKKITYSDEQLATVEAAFNPVRGYISAFNNVDFINGLPSGDICAANSFSHEMQQAQNRAEMASVNANLQFFSPETGAPLWMVGWAIPQSSTQQAHAKLFIGYMLRKEVLASATDRMKIANANLKARAAAHPDIAHNTAIYPSDDIMRNVIAVPAPTAEQLAALQKTWGHIKGNK